MADKLLVPKDAKTGQLLSYGHMFDFAETKQSAQSLQLRLEAAEIQNNIGPAAYKLPVTDMKSYLTRLQTGEGGGKFTGNQMHNPETGTAAGAYGFTKGTWIEYVDKLLPTAKGMTPDQKWELLNDPAVEFQVAVAYTEDNARMLAAAMGRPPSWDELNVAHMLRNETPAFLKALDANPWGKVKDVLSAATVANNPGLTSGTLIEFWNKRTGRTDPDWDSYMVSRVGATGTQMPKVNFFEGEDYETLILQ